MLFFFFLMIRRPPRSTLFPYTRSSDLEREAQRIHMAGLAVLRAAIRTRRVLERLEVADAVPQPVLHAWARSEEHTSELQSQSNLVCRLLLEKKKQNITSYIPTHDIYIT